MNTNTLHETAKSLSLRRLCTIGSIVNIVHVQGNNSQTKLPTVHPNSLLLLLFLYGSDGRPPLNHLRLVSQFLKRFIVLLRKARVSLLLTISSTGRALRTFSIRTDFQGSGVSKIQRSLLYCPHEHTVRNQVVHN